MVAQANAIFELLQFAFSLAVLGVVGAVALWGSLKLTRAVSASRRAAAMKEEALVAEARARAAKRAAQRLA